MRLEIIHIDRLHGPSKEFHPSQGTNITTIVVFDKQGNVPDALEFDILQQDGIGGFFQVFRGKFQRLGRIHVFPIFKPNFAVQKNVNFGGIDFRVGAIVEFREFDRVEL